MRQSCSRESTVQFMIKTLSVIGRASAGTSLAVASLISVAAGDRAGTGGAAAGQGRCRRSDPTGRSYVRPGHRPPARRPRRGPGIPTASRSRTTGRSMPSRCLAARCGSIAARSRRRRTRRSWRSCSRTKSRTSLSGMPQIRSAKQLVANGLIGLLGAVLGNDRSAQTAQIGAQRPRRRLHAEVQPGRRDARRTTVGRRDHARGRVGRAGDGGVHGKPAREQGRDPAGDGRSFLSSHPAPAERAAAAA